MAFQFDSSLPRVDFFDSILKSSPISPSVHKHVSRVYQTLLVTLATAAVGTLVHIKYEVGGIMTIIGLVAASLWFAFTPFVAGNQENENKRTGIVCLMAFLTGISIAPAISMIFELHGEGIIVQSFIITTAMFACFTVATWYSTDRIKMYTYGVLSSALLASSILALTSLFMGYGFMMNARLFLGIIIFSCYVVVDTQVMISQAEMGYKDVPAHSLQLFLDFVNLYMRVLRLLSNNKSKKKKSN